MWMQLGASGAQVQSWQQFLVEQQRGLLRFIQIVQSRCLPGATDSACPQTQN